MKSILFWPGRQTHLVEHMNLVRALKKRSDRKPIIFIDFDLTGPLKEEIGNLQIECIFAPGYPRPIGGETKIAKSKNASTLRNLKKTLIPQFLLEFSSSFFEYFRLRKRAVNLFEQCNADLFVMPAAGNLSRIVHLRVAKEKNIKSLLVCHMAKFPNRALLFKKVDISGDHVFKRIFFFFFPRLARHFDPRFRDNDFMVRNTPGQWIAAAILGALPSHPLNFGVDLVDTACVGSRYRLDLIESTGTSTKNIVVTGMPRFDDLIIPQPEKIERKIHLGVQPEKPLILCNIPHHVEHGYRTWKELEDDVRLLVDATRNSTCEVVFSHLPGLYDSKYAEIAKTAGARIAAKNELSYLLPLADIYINDYNSTTQFMAMALGIPTILYHFEDYNWDLITSAFKECPGIITVFERPALKAAVDSVASSETRLKDLAGHQRKAADYFTAHTGNATERILKEMDRLLSATHQS